MSVEEYYLAFESILYGLIVSRILVKWSELSNEKRASIYWAYVLLTVNLFLLIITVFWANKLPDHYEGVNSPLMFLFIVVIPPSIFTFMTYKMFPRHFVNTNLKEYLIIHRNRIFIPWAIYLTLQLLLLSELVLNPITLVSFVLLISTGFIIRSGKLMWIKIFLIVHTFLMLFVYLRFYIT
jgi:hypothetical protein